jgi:hypothetical protein
MNHVFISHAREDSDFAENLENRLSQAGVKTWRDTGIRGGQDWRREIDEGIRKAFALVVIITPESKTSEYVTYEWAYGWGCGTKVIPVMLKTTSLHPRLELLQYLDFTSRNARPWDDFLRIIREAEASKPLDEEPVVQVDLQIEKAELTAYKRMIEALNDEAWVWRSTERLAIIAGVSEPEATAILRHDANVVFSKGQSGRRIARLKRKIG